MLWIFNSETISKCPCTPPPPPLKSGVSEVMVVIVQHSTQLKWFLLLLFYLIHGILNSFHLKPLLSTVDVQLFCWFISIFFFVFYTYTHQFHFWFISILLLKYINDGKQNYMILDHTVRWAKSYSELISPETLLEPSKMPHSQLQRW